MSARARLVFAAAALAACVLPACSNAAATLPDPRVPARALPASIGGLDVREERDATAAFRTSADVSMVADGRLYTLRKDGAVQGSLQISALKAAYRTDEDDVRRGVRGSIELGRYRWFKLDGQWIGEQRLQEIHVYLWFPPNEHLFEVLVVRPELGIPKQLLAEIIAFQREAPWYDA